MPKSPLFWVVYVRPSKTMATRFIVAENKSKITAVFEVCTIDLLDRMSRYISCAFGSSEQLLSVSASLCNNSWYIVLRTAVFQPVKLALWNREEQNIRTHALGCPTWIVGIGARNACVTLNMNAINFVGLRHFCTPLQ